MRTTASLLPTLSALTLLATSAAGCASRAAAPGVMPPLAGPADPPAMTLVWVGRGEAERLEGGAWRRAPAFDYEFSVEQRRYPDHFESVKSLRRRHPDYDGSAGPREQTWFFRVDFAAPDAAGQVAATIRSTLGDGAGATDGEYREARLELHPDLSPLAPFDTYRITQRYRYEAGALDEEVELWKTRGEAPHAWVRNHEHAALFASRAFPAAPTRR